MDAIEAHDHAAWGESLRAITAAQVVDRTGGALAPVLKALLVMEPETAEEPAFEGAEIATLTASAGGADGAGAGVFGWQITDGPGEIVGAPDGESVDVRCTDLGTVEVSVSAGDGVCDDDATASHLITCGCPTTGDTHCDGVTVDPGPESPPGLHTITATATDDSGDVILYSFEATKGGTTFTAGPGPESSATFDLERALMQADHAETQS